MCVAVSDPREGVDSLQDSLDLLEAGKARCKKGGVILLS